MIRKYDKEVEQKFRIKAFPIACFGKFEFVEPVHTDWPSQSNSSLEDAIYGFLSKFSDAELRMLERNGLVEFLPRTTETSCHHNSRSMPCSIWTHGFRFHFNGLTVDLRWDHGWFAESGWKWFWGKRLFYSRYRIEMFHSDGEKIIVAVVPDEKLIRMLDKLENDLRARLREIEDKHEKELEVLL